MTAPSPRPPAINHELPLVVGLGRVDPEIVEPVLTPHARFVPDPTSNDLRVAAGAIVRASFDVDRSLLQRMPRLRVIARTGVGTERVDLDAARENAIPVVITPGSNTRAVAEGTFAHMLHLVKRIQSLHHIVQTGGWEKREEVSIGDLYGAGIGIVGFGRIGRRVGHLAEAFGMNVRAYDPFTPPPEDHRVATLEGLVKTSSFITLHAPLTAETHHLINAKTFAAMNPGTVLINASRGDLIDLDAAHEALISGTLGGLGLDVFSAEPPPPHPIFTHPNTLLSPHVFGLSAAATRATLIDASQGVADVLAGREPQARAV